MEYATLKLLLVPAVFALGGSLVAIVGALLTTPLRAQALPVKAILNLLSLLVLMFAAVGLLFWPKVPSLSIIGFTADPLGQYAAGIAIIGSILALLIAFHQPRLETTGEFYAMILFTALGTLLAGMANNLVVLLLAVELSSVPSYVLVGLSRRHRLAEEAAAKYFFLGALATALIAYGFVFLYGATGTLSLSHPTHLSHFAYVHWLIGLGLTIAFAGLAFKITAVPFYFYVPDVYQGAASNVTAIIAFLPKVAGFLALLRLLAFVGFDSPVWNIFWPVLWVIAVGTATAGNVLALLQTDVKRILAYSSIAHTGYMLIGLTAATGLPGGLQNGLAAVLFYVFIYGLMSLGAFGALGFLASGKKSDTGEDEEPAGLADLSGLATLRPGLALLFALFLVSLTGLPPTAGFWAKVYVFAAALSPENFWMILLVVIGLLNAAVSAAYYFRIIRWMYMNPAGPTYAAPPVLSSHARLIVPLGLILTAGLLILFGLAPGKLMLLSEVAASVLATP